ncbi:MAG TPA: hypothetical protein VI076_17650, partial [Actinopolymorphaceae bacterium]
GWPEVRTPLRLEIPDDWESYGWRHVAAAAAPVDGSDHVLIIGRAGGPEFLDSELARIGHLAGLAAVIQAGVTRTR